MSEMLSVEGIDSGEKFDWGKTSSEYAKYRDIYPEEFYRWIISLGLFTKGQRVLDVGTGTGVLPRNLARFGADITAADISENQIKYAKQLSEEMGLDIKYLVSSAEGLDFPEKSFDAITACQCHFYFKHDIFASKAHKMLTDGGKLGFMYMAWLPFEDEIAAKSEELVLKYNPNWSGCNETRHEIFIPEEYDRYFSVSKKTMFDADIPFTRESWNGRMIACRGIGASLSEEKVREFSCEHSEMLTHYPEQFTVKHYCAFTVLGKI
ncbi:MAG: class I SAM-dependent methyltransferase [Oscillospiraceae bacterium]